MSKNKKCFYEILDVYCNYSDKQIRDAYLKLAKQYHPDSLVNRVLTPLQVRSREATFKEILEAYQTLSDPEKREAYHLGRGHDHSGGKKSWFPAREAIYNFGIFLFFAFLIICMLLGFFPAPVGELTLDNVRQDFVAKDSKYSNSYVATISSCCGVPVISKDDNSFYNKVYRGKECLGPCHVSLVPAANSGSSSNFVRFSSPISCRCGDVIKTFENRSSSSRTHHRTHYYGSSRSGSSFSSSSSSSSCGRCVCR